MILCSWATPGAALRARITLRRQGLRTSGQIPRQGSRPCAREAASTRWTSFSLNSVLAGGDERSPSHPASITLAHASAFGTARGLDDAGSFAALQNSVRHMGSSGVPTLRPEGSFRPVTRGREILDMAQSGPGTLPQETCTGARCRFGGRTSAGGAPGHAHGILRHHSATLRRTMGWPEPPGVSHHIVVEVAALFKFAGMDSMAWGTCSPGISGPSSVAMPIIPEIIRWRKLRGAQESDHLIDQELPSRSRLNSGISIPPLGGAPRASGPSTPLGAQSTADYTNYSRHELGWRAGCGSRGTEKTRQGLGLCLTLGNRGMAFRAIVAGRNLPRYLSHRLLAGTGMAA